MDKPTLSAEQNEPAVVKFDGPAVNTDRELWREAPGDYYANSIHVTQGGGIGINVGGSVLVMPLVGWHRIASVTEALATALKVCADDLEAEVEHRYANTKDYPGELRRYERDIAPVRAARAALERAMNLTTHAAASARPQS